MTEQAAALMKRDDFYKNLVLCIAKYIKPYYICSVKIAKAAAPDRHHSDNQTIMKQTVQVNIGSRPFTLDEDAYTALREYFADVRSRLPETDTETEADLETRMGEILCEQVPSPMYVVSIDIVHSAIDRLGTPESFGPRHGEPAPNPQSAPESAPRRLCRSRKNRSIAGVCSGIAEYMDADPTLLRLITLLCILFGGLSIWVYVILWIVLPEEPANEPRTRNAKI